MTVTPIENELLRLIIEETARVRRLSPFRNLLQDDADEWTARSTAIRALKAGLGVKISTAWIGDDPKSRQARRRGLLALEAAGLVELFATTTGHATHVALIDPDDEEVTATASPPG